MAFMMILLAGVSTLPIEVPNEQEITPAMQGFVSKGRCRPVAKQLVATRGALADGGAIG
jgi:hypothetical protein